MSCVPTVTASRSQEGPVQHELESLKRALTSQDGSEDADLLRVGARYVELMSRSASSGEPNNILVCGEFTTTFLTRHLACSLLIEGLEFGLSESNFDNVYQTVTAIEGAPKVVILLPWISVDRYMQGFDIVDILDYWGDIWEILKKKGVGKIIQTSYDWNIPIPFSNGDCARCDILQILTELNVSLKKRAPEHIDFIDINVISSTVGKVNFYDERNYYWMRQPFTMGGCQLLAKRLTQEIRRYKYGPIKILVLDLDDTLWGGVVGEVGPQGVEIGLGDLGLPYYNFQKFLKLCRDQGLLLAVCSKNNIEDARECFRKNKQNVLTLEDFVAFECGWDTKASAIMKMSADLRLGLDNFAFFDDSPFERNLIRHTLPQVTVIEVPDQPSGYISAVVRSNITGGTNVTAEDRMRTDSYHAEARRTTTREEAPNIENYLLALGLEGDISLIDDSNVERVTQLFAKTNQFNSTTIRYKRDQVLELMGNPGVLTYVVNLNDNHGPYGIIGVALVLPFNNDSGQGYVIDSLLLSCRAIGRTVEHFILKEIIEDLSSAGEKTVFIKFKDSGKNAQVKNFIDSLGFSRSGHFAGAEVYKKDIFPKPKITTFVKKSSLSSS